MKALLFLGGSLVGMWLVGLVVAARLSERYSARTWGRFE